MASFNGFTLTNDGRNLLAKALSGEVLTFTKMEIGDGVFSGDIKTLTALVSKKNDFLINQIKNLQNGQVLLKALMSNTTIATGYYIREIGVFAKGNDNVEILYSYNKAIEADFFPAFTSSNVVEFAYENYIIVDQAQNITALINPSTTYLTKEEALEIYVLKSNFENDVRREMSYITGLPNGGTFGADLKNIIKGNSYLYIDGTGKGTIYKALNTKTNATGFLVPNSTDFMDITNSNISKYENFMEARTLVGSNGVSIQLTFIFQKVGRVVNFSIVNTSITPGVMFNDDSTIVDFNNTNYAKFKPVQFGIVQGGTLWIEEYSMIRTNTTPVSLYNQFNIARLVLMGNRMSIFGIGGLGTFDVMRVSGTYISES